MFLAKRFGSATILATVAPIALAFAISGTALAGTLDLIRQSKTIRIAYREDAPPFSYLNERGEQAGYMVDLCRAVAKQITQQLRMPALRIVYVPVTASNRFEAIEKNSADLLCEATSVTLSRRELVDFSISTYIDGASLAIRADGPRDLQAMAGRKIGVLGATTTEQALRNTLKETGVAAEVYVAKTHGEGLALLDDGAISAYFADRDILTSLIRGSKAPEKLMVADNYLTVEPYALALQHGDDAFRLAVDRALSQIYHSGEISSIFQRAFPGKSKPNQMLQTLFEISALPD